MFVRSDPEKYVFAKFEGDVAEMMRPIAEAFAEQSIDPSTVGEQFWLPGIPVHVFKLFDAQGQPIAVLYPVDPFAAWDRPVGPLQFLSVGTWLGFSREDIRDMLVRTGETAPDGFVALDTASS